MYVRVCEREKERDGVSATSASIVMEKFGINENCDIESVIRQQRLPKSNYSSMDNDFHDNDFVPTVQRKMPNFPFLAV